MPYTCEQGLLAIHNYCRIKIVISLKSSCTHRILGVSGHSVLIVPRINILSALGS